MKNIDLKIESTRLRATISSSAIAAVATYNRVRISSLEFHNFLSTGPNYVIILEDYFAEDFVIDYS